MDVLPFRMVVDQFIFARRVGGQQVGDLLDLWQVRDLPHHGRFCASGGMLSPYSA